MDRAFLSSVAIILIWSTQGMGATVTLVVGFGTGNWSIGRDPTSAELYPRLTGKKVHDFLFSADADILRIDDVRITGESGLYNSPFDSDVGPRDPVFMILIPALGADTWITTPGSSTFIVGDTSDPFGTDDNAWVDTTDDGPVTNFRFARISIDAPPPSQTPAMFTGSIVVAGTGDSESFPFAFTLSELQTFSLPEDYNENGTVDAADYTVWRDGGSPDDTVAGYDLWKANFGLTNGVGAATIVPGARSMDASRARLGGFNYTPTQ